MTQVRTQLKIPTQEMSQTSTHQTLQGPQIENKTLATEKPMSDKQSNNLQIYSQNIENLEYITNLIEKKEN